VPTGEAVLHAERITHSALSDRPEASDAVTRRQT
jgi:hypothetical protein